ncbi:MAG: C1 family peptidase [Bacteroidaceae bacterium]
MKKLFLLATLGFFLSSSARADNVKKDSTVFTTIKENPITTIKNQSRSGTCWCFSTLAFLESELLRKGKGTYDLSEAFVVRKTYVDRAIASVRMHGDVSFSQGGSFYDPIYCMENYGLMPESAMTPAGSLYGDTLFDHNELDAVTTAYVKAVATGGKKKFTTNWIQGLEGIYDSYIGAIPEKFNYNGKSYTPTTFAASLGLSADDYISITSYSHHPFYKPFAIEVQDNWRWSMSYNLPLNEMMEVIDNAINKGYTIAWGADVSEDHFNKKNVATVPNAKAKKDATGSDAARWIGTNETSQVKASETSGEKTITQEMRQIAYDNWETTDDHGMQIYGVAKNQKGDKFYMVKNSWGSYGEYKGMFYASEAYVAYKTMNFVIHKDALPKSIAKKLGVK